jgi:putative spermidine/putrescine transport system permease protein
MLEFSTRAPSGRTLTPWTSIASDQDVVQGITVSLELAAITVVIMLLLLIPTISWVHLRAPRTGSHPYTTGSTSSSVDPRSL